MLKKMTVKQLEDAKPHSVIRSWAGNIPLPWDISKEERSCFVVVRGGIPDWSIYYINKTSLTSYGIDPKLLDTISNEWISKHGQKIYSGQVDKRGKNLVQKLVPCDLSVFERYRD